MSFKYSYLVSFLALVLMFFLLISLGLTLKDLYVDTVLAKPLVQVADSWYWPMGNDGYTYAVRKNTKYQTTVENTNYNIRNLDVILGTNNITCFGVGSHRMYHAGVDLYRVGSSTARAEVKAIADGIIVNTTNNWPGVVVLIEHTLSSNDKIYSLYAHLDNVSWSTGEIISKGEIIGVVLQDSHSGRFPEFHPDGDDSHLHFEIRNFQDAAAVFPECSSTGQFGTGYTYPNLPDTYGYFDPLAFISDRIPKPNLVYIPFILKPETDPPPTCVEGQNLAENGGFEDGDLNDAEPWLQLSTDPVKGPGLIQESNMFSETRSALLGNWDIIHYPVNQELIQSFVVPANIDTISWEQVMTLDTEVIPDEDDHFILTLNDAQTGRNLLVSGGSVITGAAPYNDQWYNYIITISGMGGLVGRNISLSYTGVGDADDTTTGLLVDEVKLITHCNQSSKPQRNSSQTPPNNLLWWQVEVIPQ